MDEEVRNSEVVGKRVSAKRTPILQKIEGHSTVAPMTQRTRRAWTKWQRLVSEEERSEAGCPLGLGSVVRPSRPTGLEPARW